jgi:hypothetical protein
VLERVSEGPCGRPATRVRAVTFAGIRLSPASTGSSRLAGPAVPAGARWRVGLTDDSPVLAGRLVEAVELAVEDPDDLGVNVVERHEVLLAEHRAPHPAEPVERGRLDDPVVGAGLQVDARASGEIARHRQAGDRGAHHLLCERGQDHVDDGRLECAADEPAAERLRRELADAVGLHPRLLEQPPVNRELPVSGIVGFGELDVVLDRPALGVVGVERLVQRDPEAAQDRPPLQLTRCDHVPRPEQGLRVEVDGARVDLDVTRVGQPRTDQRPHRVQPLQHHRPVVGEVLVDGVEPAALRGRAVQLLDEQPRPRAGPFVGGGHEVTALG